MTRRQITGYLMLGVPLIIFSVLTAPREVLILLGCLAIFGYVIAALVLISDDGRNESGDIG